MSNADLYRELLCRRRLLLDKKFGGGLTDVEEMQLQSIRDDLDILDEPYLWDIERAFAS